MKNEWKSLYLLLTYSQLKLCLMQHCGVYWCVCRAPQCQSLHHCIIVQKLSCGGLCVLNLLLRLWPLCDSKELLSCCSIRSGYWDRRGLIVLWPSEASCCLCSPMFSWAFKGRFVWSAEQLSPKRSLFFSLQELKELNFSRAAAINRFLAILLPSLLQSSSCLGWAQS